MTHENGHSFFTGGQIHDSHSYNETYLRRYRHFTQPPSSSSINYQPFVDMGRSTDSVNQQRPRDRPKSHTRSPPCFDAPIPKVNNSLQETEEHEDKSPTMVAKVPRWPRQIGVSEREYCTICMKWKKCKAHSKECTLCHKFHSKEHTTIECMVGVSKFPKFMDLASELRKRIYAFALDTDRPIKPHLCDYEDEAIQFHDENQKDHFATSDLLGITRINKQTRAEALPIFYSTNTFEVGPDTTTYFDRLAYLGRFDMIRHVCFSIETRNESASPSILRRMNQYIKEADAFERVLAEPLGLRLLPLKLHPQYLYGGIPELNTLIALMKLTSSLTSEDEYKDKADTTFHSRLVVPVPSASAFASFDRLKWFPAVMYGLGIRIHYVENVSFSSVPGGVVEITWHQRFQKKDFGDIPDYINPIDTTGQTAAYKRALELDPELEQKQRPRGWTYLRTTCVGDISDWFDIATEGGGVGYGR